ncbi:hypothetical protein Scep_026420 [Stephania cephalantha]|uniref:Aminotransferase-like plant mobile domain-containing protein n=1 Tax=Stephania cephalantha TaxID=152367 RepID=A0AAP0HSI1_9MAGN
MLATTHGALLHWRTCTVNMVDHGCLLIEVIIVNSTAYKFCFITYCFIDTNVFWHGWVYEHFRLGFAVSNTKYMDQVQPRVSRWIQKHETISLQDKLVPIRSTLDKLRPNDVTWDPYVEYRSDDMVHPIAFYDRTLRYMDIVEPYHPERFLRQLGHVQDVSAPPYRPLEASRGPSALKYSVKYGFQPSIRRGGVTICWPLKLEVRRLNSSSWQHHSIFLGSYAFHTRLSRTRYTRTMLQLPVPSPIIRCLSGTDMRWTSH